MFYNLLLNQEVSVSGQLRQTWPQHAWYAKAVHTLASLGILQGVGDGRFARTVPSPERSSRSLPCGLPTWIPAARTSLPM